jgi:tetratricopeptide (TPR) repeat protein
MSAPQQERLGWLLAKLCFFEFLLELIPAQVEREVSRGARQAGLAYLRVWARYRLWLDDPSRPYKLSDFERIARLAPPGYPKVDAHYQMVAQHAKHFPNPAACEAWQPLHRRAIEELGPRLDRFDYELLLSRYHRAGGFIPQMRGDKKELQAEMERGERLARALPRRDPIRRIAADEMLYPLIQSRMQEALWLGDLDSALERIREYIRLAPNDARSWIHEGEILIKRRDYSGALASYQQAARLAPPGEEVAYFMIGQCHEAAGDLPAALDAYLQALRADPLGVSSLERAARLSKRLGQRSLARWTADRLESLRS